MIFFCYGKGSQKCSGMYDTIIWYYSKNNVYNYHHKPLLVCGNNI